MKKMAIHLLVAFFILAGLTGPLTAIKAVAKGSAVQAAPTSNNAANTSGILQKRSTSKAQSAALTWAIHNNNLPKVKQLLFEQRVDPNVSYHYYYSKYVGLAEMSKPKGSYLWEAARRGYVEIAEALIDAGADLDFAPSVSPDEHMPPLNVAAWYGRPKMVQFLINKGAARPAPES